MFCFYAAIRSGPHPPTSVVVGGGNQGKCDSLRSGKSSGRSMLLCGFRVAFGNLSCQGHQTQGWRKGVGGLKSYEWKEVGKYRKKEARGKRTE